MPARKRGPVALRHQLWLVLPLSVADDDSSKKSVNSGIYLNWIDSREDYTDVRFWLEDTVIPTPEKTTRSTAPMIHNCFRSSRLIITTNPPRNWVPEYSSASAMG
jgi:hypothetical protein